MKLHLSLSIAVFLTLGSLFSVAFASVPGQGRVDSSETMFGSFGTSRNKFMSTIASASATCSGLTYRQRPIGMGGGQPFMGIVVGDFNLDGRQDLATARSPNIQVVAGIGQGLFGAPISLGPTGLYTSIAAADFDSDGILDLVATLSGSIPRLLVFKGNGNGTFMSPSDVNVSPSSAVLAVDLNSDAKFDIIVRANDHTLKLLWGAGDGTFSPEVSISFGSGELSAYPITADLDSDGIRDLAIIGTGNTVRVRSGSGNGTFAPVANYVVETEPAWLTAGDLNSDGVPDLATAHAAAKKVSVLFGNGNGTFASAVKYTTPNAPVQIATGDLNSDGRLDLVAAGTGPDSSAAVLLGRNDGTFYNGANVGGGSKFLVVSDFDNDGHQDLLSPTRIWVLAAMLKSCPRSAFDFDGDGRANPSVWRSSNNWWYVRQDTGGFDVWQWGVAGDKLTPADFDSDGKGDIAIWRPSTGQWYIIMSASQTIEVLNWGVSGDIPVPFDNNRDGKADLVVYRPSDSKWYTRVMSAAFQDFTQTYGTADEIPLSGDFDHDLVNDLVLFRPSDSRWRYFRSSGSGAFELPWGIAGDIPVPGDYDGDGATDLAVFRPSNSRWYILGSSAGPMEPTWGQAGDIPAPADYDGDGMTDLAIFRPSEGNWYIIGSTEGWAILSFGQDGDFPVPSSYLRMN